MDGSYYFKDSGSPGSIQPFYGGIWLLCGENVPSTSAMLVGQKGAASCAWSARQLALLGAAVYVHCSRNKPLFNGSPARSGPDWWLLLFVLLPTWPQPPAAAGPPQHTQHVRHAAPAASEPARDHHLSRSLRILWAAALWSRHICPLP